MKDDKFEILLAGEDIGAGRFHISSSGIGYALKVLFMSTIYFEVSRDEGDRRGRRWGMY